jgi:hypothetical protein
MSVPAPDMVRFFLVSQHRNPLWIANQLRRDNRDRAAWSARVDFGSASRASAAIHELQNHDARAAVDVPPAGVAVDFAPHLVSAVAQIIVTFEGKLVFG